MVVNSVVSGVRQSTVGGFESWVLFFPLIEWPWATSSCWVSVFSFIKMGITTVPIWQGHCVDWMIQTKHLAQFPIHTNGTTEVNYVLLLLLWSFQPYILQSLDQGAILNHFSHLHWFGNLLQSILRCSCSWPCPQKYNWTSQAHPALTLRPVLQIIIVSKTPQIQFQEHWC